MLIYPNRYSSVWRFALVGCTNTAIDFGVFTLLRAVFDLNYLLCQTAAYVAGILNSFILNKVWTFESKTSNLHTSLQLGRFIIVNIVSLLVSLLMLNLLSGQLHMNVYLAKVTVTVFTQVINYSGYQWWVFSPKIAKPGY